MCVAPLSHDDKVSSCELNSKFIPMPTNLSSETSVMFEPMRRELEVPVVENMVEDRPQEQSAAFPNNKAFISSPWRSQPSSAYI